jgi:hypothetical protein
MKQPLSKVIVLATMIVLSACDKGGGDGGNNQPAPTAVAQVPGPQGRVMAQNDQNTFCDFNNGSFICYSRTWAAGNPQCSTPARTYTDTVTLCQQLQQLQQTDMSSCNVFGAFSNILTQYNCANVAPLVTAPPVLTGSDVNMKTVQCEMEAFRQSKGGFFRINNPGGTLSATMTFDSRVKQVIDLRRKFIIDWGNLGNVRMTFTPAGIKGVADTITLSNQGLRGVHSLLTISQSGYAGEEVRLEAASDDGSMKFSLSCKGTTPFRKNIVNKTFTKYVCRGNSRLDGFGRGEKVEFSAPYSSGLANSEVALAEGLTATFTNDGSGADNARITITALGMGENVSLLSSAYLKTTSQLNATEGVNSVNLTCGPQ